jgi:hypothetical protein
MGAWNLFDKNLRLRCGSLGWMALCDDERMIITLPANTPLAGTLLPEAGI